MHAFTALGANDEETEDAQLPPPEQSLLIRFTVDQLAELIERHLDYVDATGRSVHRGTRSFVTTMSATTTYCLLSSPSRRRDFAHPDPIGWTEANRARILKALYTILLGNPLFRGGGKPARRLVKIGLVTHGLQLCGHFPGVAGMDAIVAPAHRDQDL